MQKRIAAVLCVLCLLFPCAATAENVQPNGLDGVSGALLIEAGTGTPLYAKDADTRRAVAGLAKLPAILTLCQSADDGTLALSGEISVSERAAGIPGPTAFLEAGERAAAESLIKAAVMISAGDAITALGEAVCGSESVFLNNVNATLRGCGIEAGVPDAVGTGLGLSARELTVLGRAAVNSPTFLRYAVLYLDTFSHADGRETELVNANRLLRSYPGCIGLLTGSSQTDGYCGVFAAKQNGTVLIAAIIGAKDANVRTTAAAALLDYGFSGFRYERLAKAGEVFAEDVPVRGGEVRLVNLIAREDTTAIFRAGQGKLDRTVEVPEYLEAPVDADTACGRIVYRDTSGSEVGVLELFPERDVKKFGFREILRRIADTFCG